LASVCGGSPGWTTQGRTPLTPSPIGYPFSATNSTELAASAYLEAGGWSERPVIALRETAEGRGDEVVVLGADGQPVVGSPPSAADWAAGERAPIVVRGEQVGTIIANHSRTAGVDSAAKRLDHHLQTRMRGLLLAAGIVAGGLALALALVLALYLARPLQRLTEAARRMGSGELETRATGSGGGREMTRLAETMDRLATTLRRQDELRRATAADVTHELRGALVGVSSRVEALRHGFVDDEELALAQIQGDAHRVRRLVDDVDRLAEAQRPGLLVHKRPIDLDAIVHACVASYADRARLLFTVDTLEFLARGGRIGKARAMAGQLLHIKPILAIRDGEVEPIKRVRGNQKAFMEFVSQFREHSTDGAGLRVGIAHADAPDRATQLQKMVRHERPHAEIDVITTLGAVVGTHAGPGTVGFFWFDDEE